MGQIKDTGMILKLVLDVMGLNWRRRDGYLKDLE